MSIKFWLLSGCYWERRAECGKMAVVGSQQSAPTERSLHTLVARSIEHTREYLLGLWEEYELQFQQQWKLRALLTAALCEPIIAVSFHPTGLKKPQILYAMKGEELKDIPGFTVPHFKDQRLLDAQYLTFDLSKMNLSKSLQLITKINDQHKEEIRATLLRFKKDPETQGISLTIKNEEGALKTYLWLKPTSH